MPAPGWQALVAALALLLACGLPQSAPALDLDQARETAAQGDADALFALGAAYEQADGVEQDLALAAAYFELAAERGHPAAQYRLGVLRLAGVGTAPDPAAAYPWLALAARGSDDEAGLVAGALRDALAAELSPAQLDEAQAQVAAFAPENGPAALPAPGVAPGGLPPTSELAATLAQRLELAGCGEAQVVETEGRVEVAGFVPDDAEGERLNDALEPLVERQPVRLDLVALAPELCAVLDLLSASGSRLERLEGVVLRAAQGSPTTTFRDGDHLVVEIPPQARDTYVWVDYFVHDGEVLHMLPSPITPDNALPAGEPLVLGDPGGPGEEWVIGPPFGRDLVVLFVTNRPLYEGARPQVEPASEYLAFLRRRFASVLPDDAIRAAHRVVQTVGG